MLFLSSFASLRRCVVLVCVVLLLTSPLFSQTFITLHSFTGGSDGGFPYAGLTRDPAGNLYGTTSGGPVGLGTVFKIDTSNNQTVLHSFIGGSDGTYPRAGLTRDAAGNLYGTTWRGGSSGAGTVFKIDTSNHETVLYSFTGGSDGGFPYAGLTRDPAGNLYGTTVQGGSSGAGTVFKIDTSNYETVLHSFTGGSDGGYPYAGLTWDASGNLYGTTVQGGSSGYGTVFKIDTSNNETVLYSFIAGSDGAQPEADLIMDAAGNLYGTTMSGGSVGLGTVFKIDTSNHETVLYSFTGGSDGAYPQAGLIRDASGNLYGTTTGGGSGGSGIVFKIDTSYNETVLYSFTGGSDGAQPEAGLIMDALGNLYGTTYQGGASYGGTLFELQMPDDDSNYALLNGNDTFNGNQTVNGSVKATNFLGDGSNLTNLNAANLVGTASINITGNAATATLATSAANATNADNLGGIAAASYARLDSSNNFNALQNLSAGIRIMGGSTFLSPSTTDFASLNVPNTGAAPNAPNLGDLWLTAGDIHLQFRDNNGVTQALAFVSELNPQDNNFLSQAKSYTDSQVGTEKTRAQGAESSLSAAISGETSRATLAEASLGSAISGETTRAQSAEANKANLSGANTFNGNQTVTGNETVSGNVGVAGTVTLGGGTAITKHVSAVLNPSLPGLKSLTCATVTFTLPGVSDGDTTALGVASTRMAGGSLVYTAWVSAADTITIQACNVGQTQQKNAGTGNIRVDVWKH
jgi:uncharacterized repeat protein (TIGR03803 family)